MLEEEVWIAGCAGGYEGGGLVRFDEDTGSMVGGGVEVCGGGCCR